MLEKEYLICFKAYFGDGGSQECDIVRKTTEKVNQGWLVELREELRSRLYAQNVVFTNVVCLGEVDE